MTNRERLLNTNIYDLLLLMNKEVIQMSNYETCVLETLEHKHVDCEYFICAECIQNYLNKEV